jgi:hypothetical protein
MGTNLSRDEIDRQHFEELCRTSEDQLLMAEKYRIAYKLIYNDLVGWSLPSRKACDYIAKFWSVGKRIVDFGAGTGHFCAALHQCGIPKHNLVAVDQNEEKRLSRYKPRSRYFWPIVEVQDFTWNYESDILLIAWGVHKLEEVIESFIANKGKTVIIVGETDCTLSWAYFFPDECQRPGWSTQSMHVKGPASQWSERVSINSCEQV